MGEPHQDPGLGPELGKRFPQFFRRQRAGLKLLGSKLHSTLEPVRDLVDAAHAPAPENAEHFVSLFYKAIHKNPYFSRGLTRIKASFAVI
jgi:hypothetical protein